MPNFDRCLTPWQNLRLLRLGSPLAEGTPQPKGGRGGGFWGTVQAKGWAEANAKESWQEAGGKEGRGRGGRGWGAVEGQGRKRRRKGPTVKQRPGATIDAYRPRAAGKPSPAPGSRVVQEGPGSELRGADVGARYGIAPPMSPPRLFFFAPQVRAVAPCRSRRAPGNDSRWLFPSFQAGVRIYSS